MVFKKRVSNILSISVTWTWDAGTATLIGILPDLTTSRPSLTSAYPTSTSNATVIGLLWLDNQFATILTQSSPCTENASEQLTLSLRKMPLRLNRWPVCRSESTRDSIPRSSPPSSIFCERDTDRWRSMATSRSRNVPLLPCNVCLYIVIDINWNKYRHLYSNEWLPSHK